MFCCDKGLCHGFAQGSLTATTEIVMSTWEIVHSSNGLESSSSSPMMTSIVSPPTPAPSPRPEISHELGEDKCSPSTDNDELDYSRDVQFAFQRLDSSARKRFLADLLATCDVDQLVFVSNVIAPRLKRDFLRELPIEISLHVLSFIDDPRSLARAASVSRFWRGLLNDEFTWKIMCQKHHFGVSFRGDPLRFPRLVTDRIDGDSDSSSELVSSRVIRSPRTQRPIIESKRALKQPRLPTRVDDQFSYRRHFKTAYLTGT